MQMGVYAECDSGSKEKQNRECIRIPCLQSPRLHLDKVFLLNDNIRNTILEFLQFLQRLRLFGIVVEKGAC